MKKFALVKWMTGHDAGKYTVVQSTLIRDFNSEKFEEGLGDSSFEVEWRSTDPRRPLGLWPVFDGIVIATSDEERKLNKMMEMISPATNVCNVSEVTNENKKRKSTGETLHQIKKVLKENHDNESPNSSKKATIQSIKNIGILQIVEKLGIEADDAEAIVTIQNENHELLKENENLKAKLTDAERVNQELRELNYKLQTKILSDVPPLFAAINGNGLAAGRISTAAVADKQEVRPLTRAGSKVELYIGSDVYVDMTTLALAKRTTSVARYIGLLLMDLFSMETLLLSNYRGGKSKISGTPSRPGLDVKIIDALNNAFMKDFPEARPGDFGSAVNAKLNNLRYKQSRRLKEDKKEML